MTDRLNEELNYKNKIDEVDKVGTSDEYLEGGAGVDILNGCGPGNEMIFGDEESVDRVEVLDITSVNNEDLVQDSTTTEVLEDYIMYGSEGDDKIKGGGCEGYMFYYDDEGVVYGDTSTEVLEDDIISGGYEKDYLEGDDILFGDDSSDVLMDGGPCYGWFGEYEEHEADVSQGYELLETDADKILVVSPGEDQIVGGCGDDTIYGYAGNDVLRFDTISIESYDFQLTGDLSSTSSDFVFV